jgi:site-specific recombinase XerD
MKVQGGGKKAGQAKEITVDLSKFLQFCSPEEIDLTNVCKPKSIEDYLDELQRRKVGPSEIISKLNVLNYAQTFIVHR